MRMKIKTFMFAALAAFATLFAGCSDDENKTNGDNNGTGGDPVRGDYRECQVPVFYGCGV